MNIKHYTYIPINNSVEIGPMLRPLLYRQELLNTTHLIPHANPELYALLNKRILVIMWVPVQSLAISLPLKNICLLLDFYVGKFYILLLKITKNT